MREQGHFTPRIFQFLRELAAHNDKDWFQTNKHRYEADVRQPVLRFVEDFAAQLRTISKHFEADPRPVGGSMFRIHRDTRFSKDKSPYKTNVGAHFPHGTAGKDVHAPGFYLHLEPGGSMGGGGLWHPDGPALKKVRDRIAGRPRDWKKILDAGTPISGDALKRPPAGYAPDHPFLEDLKRKDFYTMTSFSEKEVCAPDFIARYTEACRLAGPLVEFLTKSVGLSW